MRRPSKPLLIAGIPIAGLALASYNGSSSSVSAWSPAPHSTTVSSSRRSSLRSPKSTVLLSAIEDEATDLSTLHLTPQLTMMVNAFSSIPDEKTRHKQLLYMASKLPDVTDAVRISENKVPGCLSTVHVDCTLEPKQSTDDSDESSGEMVVNYIGDSDGLLTKGLLALLIRGLSGCTPQEIQKVDPTFIQVAKISQTLTPGRNNGFLNMLAVMKKKALDAEAAAEKGKGTGSESTKDAGEEEEEEQPAAIITSFEEIDGKPMYNTIMSTLITILKPTSITLTDNSDQHAGHAGSKGWAESGESHFALTIVAEAFDGLSLVKRHQLIYMLLGETMEKIHALEIKAKSPGEV
jgi:sulfur transfer protein SufE/stress-induced morphogen